MTPIFTYDWISFPSRLRRLYAGSRLRIYYPLECPSGERLFCVGLWFGQYHNALSCS